MNRTTNGLHSRLSIWGVSWTNSKNKLTSLEISYISKMQKLTNCSQPSKACVKMPSNLEQDLTRLTAWGLRCSAWKAISATCNKRYSIARLPTLVFPTKSHMLELNTPNYRKNYRPNRSISTNWPNNTTLLRQITNTLSCWSSKEKRQHQRQAVRQPHWKINTAICSNRCSRGSRPFLSWRRSWTKWRQIWHTTKMK